MHKDSVVAWACIARASGETEHVVAAVGTTTTAVLALSDWLTAHGCTHVAMEATGVYWKPVWHLLEDTFTLVRATARHIKNVPGRKTDVNDATWAASPLPRIASPGLASVPAMTRAPASAAPRGYAKGGA